MMLPTRPVFRDTTWQEAAASGFDMVEPKFDGHLGFLHFDGAEGYSIYSRTGTLEASGKALDRIRKPCLLVGEHLIGTHWSKQGTRHNEFHAFDILTLLGVDVSELPFSKRRHLLQELLNRPSWMWLGLASRLKLLPQHTLSHAPKLWAQFVENGDGEGLVFKDSDSPWSAPVGRQKREIEMDYVILGTEASDSTTHGAWGIKAFRLGLFIDGVLTEVAKVGGMTQAMRADAHLHSYAGRVITVRGKALFPSGALRHPSVVRLRDDKNPADCRLPTNTQETKP